MFEWAVDRIHILQDFASRNCQVANCGGKDDEGEPIPCSGSGCGERRIHADHRRELRVMRDLKALIEALELKELQALAAADKKGKGR